MMKPTTTTSTAGRDLENDTTNTTNDPISSLSLLSSMPPPPPAPSKPMMNVNDNNNNNNNNNNDDDDDEFAHLSLDHDENDNMITTTTNNNNNNNNNNHNHNHNDTTENDINDAVNTFNDDDNDDDTTTTMIFDLQMTIATMETEQEFILQRIQQQHKCQIRYYQDEVRKLYNETNVLRFQTRKSIPTIVPTSSSWSSSKSSSLRHTNHNTSNNNRTSYTTTTVTQPPPQPHQPPGANLFARSNAILSVSSSSTPSSSSSISQTPPRPATTTATATMYHNDSNIHQQQQQQQQQQPENTGRRLIHQLIRQKQPQQQQQQTNRSTIRINNDNQDNDYDKDIAIRLIQMLSTSTFLPLPAIPTTTSQQQPSSSSSSSQLSEWDVIHWLLIEIVQIHIQFNHIINTTMNSTTTTTKTNTMTNRTDATSHVNNNHNSHKNMNRKSAVATSLYAYLHQLPSLLHWLFDALLLCSPTSYQPIVLLLVQPQSQKSSGNTSLGASNYKNSTTTSTTVTNHDPYYSFSMRKRNRRPTSISVSVVRECTNSTNNDTNTNNHANAKGNVSTATTTTATATTLYQILEQQLSSPLWNGCCLRPISANVVQQHHQQQQHPSIHLQSYYFVQRYVQDCLLPWCDIGHFLLSLSTVGGDSKETLPTPMTTDENDKKDENHYVSTKKESTKLPVVQQISLLSIQIITFLLFSHSNPSNNTHCNDDKFSISAINDQIAATTTNQRRLSQVLEQCCDRLLMNILQFGIHILVYPHPVRPQHSEGGVVEIIESTGRINNSNIIDSTSSKYNHDLPFRKNQRNNRNINISNNHMDRQKYKTHEAPALLRLIHINFMDDYMEGIESEDNNDTKNKSDRIPIDSIKFAPFNIYDSLTWMAEALNLLQNVIWAKQRCAEDVNSLSQQEMIWIQTKRTAALMGILLDVLEHTILPNMNLFNHPYTINCVRWMQQLIEQPFSLSNQPTTNRSATNVDAIHMLDQNDDADTTHHCYYNTNYYYWRLLRTQNVTNNSTAELWHTGPTAINVLIQIFTRIVLQQMSYDHIPSDANQVVPLLPLRDEIIRFMHRIVLHVQNDRQIWEQQHYKMKQIKLASASTKGSHVRTATKKERMRPMLSFIMILSEQVEIYKSMITSLLSSYCSSNDTNGIGRTNSYYCLNDDIYAMVKLQLDEIVDDQYEKLQHG